MAKVVWSLLSLLAAAIPSWAMIGGQRVNDPRFVFMSYRKGSYISYQTCSAIAIKPNVLITAGHCVYLERDAPFLSNGKVIEIETARFDKKYDERTIFQATVEKIHIHPSWKNGMDANSNPNQVAERVDVSDLAIIELKQNLQVTPAILTSGENALDSVRIFGGGKDSDEDGDFSVYPKTAVLPLLAHLQAQIKLGPKDISSGLLANVRNGDSGGGVFQNTQTGSELVGIISYTASENSQQSSIHAASLLDREIQNWIQENSKYSTNLSAPFKKSIIYPSLLSLQSEMNESISVKIIQTLSSQENDLNSKAGKGLVYLGIGQSDLTDQERKKLSGQIAVFDRGVITFGEKIEKAMEAGAVGALFINNTITDIKEISAIEGIYIPYGIISRTDGEKLKKMKNVTIN